MAIPIIETVGKVLYGLVDRVFTGIQATIEQQRLAHITVASSVHDAGISLQMEAGRQARLAIENFKNAYTDSLDVTVDKVSPEIQKNLATLAQLVDDVVNPKVQALQDFSLRVQNLILRLPFVNKTPYLNKSTPNFVAFAQDGRSVIVRFMGHFPKDKKTSAVLTVGGHIFKPEGDLNTLTCLVPISILCQNKSDAASLIDADFKLNWVERGYLFPTSYSHAYKIWFGLLPSSPGELTVVYKQKNTTQETRPFLSNEFLQHSGSSGGGLSIIGKQYPIAPERGWQVVRGSSDVVIIEQRPKNSSYSFVSDDRGQVVYSVTTMHVPKKGDSGKIRFKIKFNQTREIPGEENKETDYKLKWGETKVLDSDKGLNKVVFDAFTRLRYEFSGVSSQNPFIKIRNEGGKLVLTAVAPEELSVLNSLPPPNL